MDADQPGRARIEAVTASSRTFASVLESDESFRDVLYSADPLAPDRHLDLMRAAFDRGGAPELRREKRRRLLAIAARDLAGELSLEAATGALADLADACLQVALEDTGAQDELAIIGMGKLGGRELNYYSDIDVMFVADDPGTASSAGERVLRTLAEFSPEGQVYRVDANLRPEGRSGALVRSLDGYLEYYRRWAKPWEHQALIKARACAGASDLGKRLVEETRSFVFPRDISSERVASIRRMKERVEEHALRSSRRGSEDGGNVKLGPGGIRDIEFSVQLLQLVHGAADASVRSPATLEAIVALVEGGYLAEEDGAGLSVAYRWLRSVEHRLQLWQERRTHQLPGDEAGRARVARAMGFRDSPIASAAQRFDDVHSAVLADVRNRFERLFYRPMIESLSEGSGPRLSPEGLRERLLVLGFRDVERAARTLDGLVSGTSRRARLFRLLTPAYLRYVASSPVPDEGLFAFLRLGEAVGGRLDALNALRENPPGIEFLARFLGSGRLLGDVLEHVPEELQAIADQRIPEALKDRDRLVREAAASLEWREPERRLDGLRRFKRRAMLQVALADIGGTVDVETVGAGLADLADACVEGALKDIDAPFAVIGMGKLGGRELNYSSDIDVMFVHDTSQEEAEGIAEGLLRSIGEVTPEGQAFRIDANLRPEGKSGPLTRSLDSYLEYYARWAKPWEYQALLKARVAAGDTRVGDALIEGTRRFAYPEQLSADVVTQIRHLKARMERERIPRGTDPRRHLKLGPGGLSDVEFSAQILQLQHAHRVESLRVTSTLPALRIARDEGLLSEDDARRLDEAYIWLMRLRNRLFFLSGRPIDALPPTPEGLEALGIAMGYQEQPRQELEETYLRITRRARRSAESLIYGGRR